MGKKERRAALIAEMREMNEKVKVEKRAFNDDEAKLYADKEAEVRQLSAEIAAEEREAMLAGFSSELPPKNNGSEKHNAENNVMTEFRGYLQDGRTETRTALTYADGGAAIAPMEFSKELIAAIEKEAQFYGMVEKIPVVGAGSLGIPYEAADASGASWTAEVPNNEISEDTSLAYGKRELKPTDLVKLIKISKKLLKGSALPIEEIIQKKLASKIVAAFENGILTGSGSAQPLGVFTASSDGVATARDVATTYTSSTEYMTADDLKRLKMSLRPGYRKNAVWAISTDVLLDVMLFKDSNGQYIWQPGLRDGDPDKLLGMPVFESEYAPSTKTSGSYIAVLGDFRNYYKFAYWEGIDIQVLVEKFAGKNQIGFLAHTLADGMPVLGEAFARLKVGTAST